jgi:predicted 2-oxoglutarate/Fe(II)-dependent dioxygenase YbiX
MIVQIENAISTRQCQELMDIYDHNFGRSDVKDYTGHPVLYWAHIQDISNAKSLFTDLITRCICSVMHNLCWSASVFPETAILATMGPGGHHPRHADNRQEDEQGNWVPNHTPNRAVSAIYYLNGNFEGGQLIFEQYELVITPSQGLLVIFPSDERHVHEVLPVSTGRRYTATFWFTENQRFALSDFEHCATERE